MLFRCTVPESTRGKVSSPSVLGLPVYLDGPPLPLVNLVYGFPDRGPYLPGKPFHV